jgi:Ca2+-binding RTX toxin-like protein
MAIIIGNANSEVLPGTADDDVFQFFQGGNDTLTGAGGNDEFVAGGAFTAQDRVDGGTGFDTLRLNGNYGGGITFANTTMTTVEMIRFDPGSNYSITTHDANVAAGTTLIIEGRYMNAGSQITFNGANENTGYFSFYGGDANENYTGGVREDYFAAAGLGNDTLNGGGGNDSYQVDGNLTALDQLNGGAGADRVTFDGDYTTLVNFVDTTMQSIESVYFASGNNYSFRSAEGTVAAGQTMFLDGRSIGAAHGLIWNGSLETDGSFAIYDGQGTDVLTGGQMNDEFRFFGGASDFANGQAGDDIFLMGGTLDAGDQINGGAGNDLVTLSGDYSAGLALGAALQNIESLQLSGGFSYRLTASEMTVAAGQNMQIQVALGATETFTFNGAAETNGTFSLYDGLGADSLTGGQGNDYISGQTGGVDTLFGAGGDDFFAFFSEYTTADFVNGGTGNDTFSMSSDTSAGIVIGAQQFVSVENFSFSGDYDVRITALNSLVAGGVTARVEATFLSDGFGLDFDGSAETNGAYDLTGSSGNDRLASGAGNDRLDGDIGGIDTLIGGAGDDIYQFAAGDIVIELANGGTDTIENNANITLANFANVENATLLGLGNLNASGTAGNNVLRGNGGNNILNGNGGADTLEGGSGSDIYYVDSASDVTIEENYADIDLVSASISRTLSVNIENLNLSGTGNIDGNGNASANVINGNTGNNILRGYDNGDTLNGKEGQDILLGGAGRDTLNPGIDAVRDIIRFSAVTDSTGPARDLVSGIDLTAEDVFDFTVVPVSIAAAVNAGTLNEASFDADLTAAIGAAQLGVGQAVLFDASAGDLNIAGHRYLVVDANGEAGYQAGEDYVVQLVNATGSLTLDDFS